MPAGNSWFIIDDYVVTDFRLLTKRGFRSGDVQCSGRDRADFFANRTMLERVRMIHYYHRQYTILLTERKTMQYLSQIDSPKQLKRLSLPELEVLAGEIRQVLIDSALASGGHLGPNLGVVELTLALHYVFDSPRDKFIFDVSHQCYTHKILTGRKRKFLDPAADSLFTGYTNPRESEHDTFLMGHTSTSVSLAAGLAAGRDRCGDDYRVVAVIGDGALSGGEAFEGLNNAAELDGNLLIIVNDNDMSIAENHGGIYRNLRELRRTGGQSANNFFTACGLAYRFVEDGHDLGALIRVFTEEKDRQRPLVIHVCTQKGKGYEPAERDREAYHHLHKPGKSVAGERGDAITRQVLLKKMAADPSVITVCPAVPRNVGADTAFREQAGRQYIDVGIAEAHAVSFAAGMAKAGAKPVVLDYGTFLQRTYDQLMHDLAINGSSAVILSFTSGGGISAMDAAHASMYDLAMTASIPGLLCLAPATKGEFVEMLEWAVDQQEEPVVIRVPNRIYTYQAGRPFTAANRRQFQLVRTGKEVAFIGLGQFYDLACQACNLLARRYGIAGSLINPRVYSEVDETVLQELAASHRLVVTLEDGIVSGGFGQRVASFYGTTAVQVLSYGAEKEFTNCVPLSTLYSRYRLDPACIVADIARILQAQEPERTEE